MESGFAINIYGDRGVIELDSKFTRDDAEWIADCLVDVMVVDGSSYIEDDHTIMICWWHEPVSKADVEQAMLELVDELAQKKSPANLPDSY